MEKVERARQAAWDKRKLRTVSTHLTTAEHDTLQRICKAKGTTPYRVLQDYLQHYIRAAAQRLQL